MHVVVVLTQIALLWRLSWASSASSSSPGPTPSDNSVSSSSYCVFLESSLELDCVCSEWAGRPFSFPPKDLLMIHAPNVTLASVRLHSCNSVQVALHFTQMTSTFRRLRIEDVPEVTVEGISVVSANNVELWFRNINTSLVLTGAIDCAGCDVDSNATNASFSMHMLDVRNVSVNRAVVSLCPQIRVRGAHSVTLQDSFFRWVPHNGIEIFNATNVTVLRSELAEAGRGAVMLQRVAEVAVIDSLVGRSAVEVVRNETPIVWRCTMPADGGPSGMTDEEMSVCAVEGRLMTSLAGSSEQWLAPSGGAIALAAVSAAMLVLVVAGLVFMHRTGRLEQYL